MILGLPFSYRVFQEFYSKNEPLSQYPQGIASVGTTTTVSIQTFRPTGLVDSGPGPLVLPITCRRHSPPAMALSSTIHHSGRSSIGHSVARRRLLLNPGIPPYPHPGSTLWHRRSLSIQSIRVLPPRMVHRAQRSCVWDSMGGNGHQWYNSPCRNGLGTGKIWL